MPATVTSAHLFGEDTLMLQRFLKLAGFDPGALDGRYGARTDSAAEAFYETTRTIATNQGTFDARSEANIASLIPSVQRSARTFLQRCKEARLDVRIISSTRSYAEQDKLYAQGRINIAGVWTRVPGLKIVTKARGGYSWHNFGLAFDIGVFVERRYIKDEMRPYQEASRHAEGLGLGWGGNWKGTLIDPPHYQLDSPGLKISDVRKRFESGEQLPLPGN